MVFHLYRCLDIRLLAGFGREIILAAKEYCTTYVASIQPFNLPGFGKLGEMDFESSGMWGNWPTF